MSLFGKSPGLGSLVSMVPLELVLWSLWIALAMLGLLACREMEEGRLAVFDWIYAGVSCRVRLLRMLWEGRNGGSVQSKAWAFHHLTPLILSPESPFIIELGERGLSWFLQKCSGL